MLPGMKEGDEKVMAERRGILDAAVMIRSGQTIHGNLIPDTEPSENVIDAMTVEMVDDNDIDMMLMTESVAGKTVSGQIEVAKNAETSSAVH